MFKFGKASMRHILSLHEDLQAVLLEAIKTSKIDFCVYCGHRGEKAQNAAFNAGKSQLQYPASLHNKLPSMAFDFAPYYRANPHIRWENESDFKKVAKHIMATAKKMDIKLEWGGDWETFVDMPHIQKV
jgi:peptidoglycan L-alanyl-D-glutamate endopeptidase CwlK